MENETQDYLDRFFEEKNIQFESWELKNSEGVSNFIDTDFVVNYLQNGLDLKTKRIVVNKLRQLDFNNAPIEPFLKYVALGIIG